VLSNGLFYRTITWTSPGYRFIYTPRGALPTPTGIKSQFSSSQSRGYADISIEVPHPPYPGARYQEKPANGGCLQTHAGGVQMEFSTAEHHAMINAADIRRLLTTMAGIHIPAIVVII